MGTVPTLVSAGNQSMSDGLQSLLSPSIWQQTHVLTCWVHVMPDPSVRSGQKHNALRVYKEKTQAAAVGGKPENCELKSLLENKISPHT